MKHITTGVACLAIAALLLAGCRPSSPREIRIAGAGDLYYLAVVLNEQYAKMAGIDGVSMALTTESIGELKRGKRDAVLLGREPTPEELEGLEDRVVAYDAVCIILDTNSFLGGTSFGAGRPLRRASGLRELSSDNLNSVFTSKWAMAEGYYTVNTQLDPQSWLWNVEEVVWVHMEKPVSPAFFFPLGKFDTQTVLYNKLGLDESTLLAGRESFSQPRFSREEQVLSYEYNLSVYGRAAGTQDFAFKLAFASRRAMTVAPKHIPVKVIAVDGVDPLADPQSIYDGSYLLSRRIHLLFRKDGPAKAEQLAEFLLSTRGQEMIAGIGYLPLSPGNP